MSSILIIADGKVSQEFIEKVESKKLAEHKYTVVMNCSKPKENSNNIHYENLDPTSLFRLRTLCHSESFRVVFIVLANMKESEIVYKNIRSFDKKIRIVILDTNGHFRNLKKDIYVNTIDAMNVLTNRLYHYLPNVPVTAQSIGLAQGEIMEVIVPFSSTYAFRHISSIPQIKWKIAAIYRDDKLLLPTNATMIRPRDMLLLVGRPQILRNVYKRIRSKSNIFPEPFGKNLYLYLDIDRDESRALEYIQEAIYLLDKFENKTLIIRVVNPNNIDIVDRIKSYEKENIYCYFSYGDMSESTIASDILEHEIGLIFLSFETLKVNAFSHKLYAYKKLIYIFGNTPLKDIKEATVVCSENKSMEAISSVTFYIKETLKIQLSLRDYSPQGNFENSKFVIENFETLAHVHNTKIDIIQERKNPITAIKNCKKILLIIPFKENMDFKSIKAFFQRDVDSLLLRTNTHPKILIPIAEV